MGSVVSSRTLLAQCMKRLPVAIVSRWGVPEVIGDTKWPEIHLLGAVDETALVAARDTGAHKCRDVVVRLPSDPQFAHRSEQPEELQIGGVLGDHRC
jgi:hypothetical protein